MRLDCQLEVRELNPHSVKEAPLELEGEEDDHNNNIK